MRNIFKISAIALASALAFAACQEPEPVWQPKETLLTITKADLLFDANGGTGYATFEAKGSVTIDCQSDWCTATLNGNTVEVSAPDYGGLDGRSAAIDLTCNGETVRLTAQQSGIIFSFIDEQIDVEMAGESFDIYGKSSKPITITADDWIEFTPTETGISVNIGENTSGDNRIGYIKVISGDVVATYTINHKFDRNFAGEYTLTRFTGSAETTTDTVDVTIEKDATAVDMYYIVGFKTYNKIPLYFDASKNKLFIENGTYLGVHTDNNYLYVVKTMAKADGTGYLSYTKSDAFNVWFDFTYEDGKYTLTSNLDPPSSSYAISTGFTVYTFTVSPESGTALATGNRKSSILVVRKPVLKQK